jgi:hypothetical protein
MTKDETNESGDICDVCGRKYIPGLSSCEHSPEAHALATVRRIIDKHGPALREAFVSTAPKPEYPAPTVQAVDGLVERLRKKSVGLTASSDTIRVTVYPALLREAASTISSLQERLAEAVEALRPFARLAQPIHPVEEPNGHSTIDWMTRQGEDEELSLSSTVGPSRDEARLFADDFRRAASVLCRIEGGDGSSVADSAGEGLRPFASDGQRKSEGGK